MVSWVYLIAAFAAGAACTGIGNILAKVYFRRRLEASE